MDKEPLFEFTYFNRNAVLLTIIPVYVSKNTGLYFLILLFLSIWRVYSSFHCQSLFFLWSHFFFIKSIWLCLLLFLVPFDPASLWKDKIEKILSLFRIDSPFLFLLMLLFDSAVFCVFILFSFESTNCRFDFLSVFHFEMIQKCFRSSFILFLSNRPITSLFSGLSWFRWVFWTVFFVCVFLLDVWFSFFL